ncbi:MAG TPA: hypothetical protein VFD82_00055 [Planctomycetota bacterium]|nr:hypothetical protein [Planctomycetota bacterium]
MPDELTYRSSPSKGLQLVVLSGGFVALGFWLATRGLDLVDWLAAGFFALGTAIGLLMILWPNSMHLRLDAEGFEIGSFAKKFRVRWSDVQGFEMRSMHQNKMIAIVYAPHYSAQRIGRAVASTLSGMEGAIANMYNAPLDEILDVLNEWRARYGEPR